MKKKEGNKEQAIKINEIKREERKKGKNMEK